MRALRYLLVGILALTFVTPVLAALPRGLRDSSAKAAAASDAKGRVLSLADGLVATDDFAFDVDTGAEFTRMYLDITTSAEVGTAVVDVTLEWGPADDPTRFKFCTIPSLQTAITLLVAVGVPGVLAADTTSDIDVVCEALVPPNFRITFDQTSAAGSTGFTYDVNIVFLK